MSHHYHDHQMMESQTDRRSGEVARMIALDRIFATLPFFSPARLAHIDLEQMQSAYPSRDLVAVQRNQYCQLEYDLVEGED
jgi:hypothetical protein